MHELAFHRRRYELTVVKAARTLSISVDGGTPSVVTLPTNIATDDFEMLAPGTISAPTSTFCAKQGCAEVRNFLIWDETIEPGYESLLLHAICVYRSPACMNSPFRRHRYELLHANVECKSADSSMGTVASLEKCAEACERQAGCKYFV